jgi:hypothetical protein
MCHRVALRGCVLSVSLVEGDPSMRVSGAALTPMEEARPKKNASCLDPV